MVNWNRIGNGLVRDGRPCIELRSEPDWHLIDVVLALDWHWIGIGLAMDWTLIDVGLTPDWHWIGRVFWDG